MKNQTQQPTKGQIPEALRQFAYNLDGAQHSIASALSAYDELVKLGHALGPEWLEDSLRQTLVTLAGVELLSGIEID